VSVTAAGLNYKSNAEFLLILQKYTGKNIRLSILMKYQTCQEKNKNKKDEFEILQSINKLFPDVQNSYITGVKKLATHFDNEEMPHTVNNIVLGHFKLSLKHAD
jgi:hypothetical protein